MDILTVTNQKGGVGKTTTAASLAAALSARKKRVLAIDLDPQCNLTRWYGAEPGEGASAADVLSGGSDARSAVISTQQGELLAASPALASSSLIQDAPGKEHKLREALAPLAGDYDIAIVDTPPALGLMTVNALTAASHALIAAQADAFSLQGMAALYETIRAVREYCNGELSVIGIIVTRFSSRAVISRDAVEMMQEFAARVGTKVFGAKIRECSALKEAQLVGRSIFDHAPRSNAAADYKSLTTEVLKAMKR